MFYFNHKNLEKKKKKSASSVTRFGKILNLINFLIICLASGKNFEPAVAKS